MDWVLPVVGVGVGLAWSVLMVVVGYSCGFERGYLEGGADAAAQLEAAGARPVGNPYMGFGRGV